MSRFLILFLIFAAFSLPLFALASATDGTIDTTSKYAWSENAGWINFGTTNGDVHVTDSGLTGYAWNENYGWINLAPANSGVANDGEGNLSGYAWGEGVGWIDFSTVTISETGEFGGSATNDVLGHINFDCTNCGVTTDYRPITSRPADVPPANNPGGHRRGGGGDQPPFETPTVETPSVTPTQPAGVGFLPDLPSPNQIISYIGDVAVGAMTSISNLWSGNLLGGAMSGISSLWSSDILSRPFAILPGFFQSAPQRLITFLPEFLRGGKTEVPIELVVPKQAQMALRGDWDMLSNTAIGNFVLAPLPRNIASLAEKFPGLGKTLREVGITKVTDIRRLNSVSLSLPGLTETIGLPASNLAYGKFTLPAGVPLSELDTELKRKIPTEIVFAKAGGELIDFNIALTVGEKGETEQKIQTVVGKPMQLVVKPDKPVKAIKGYVVFKSKKRPPARTGQPSSYNPVLNQMTASVLFSEPQFSRVQEMPVEEAEELVLIEFEYTDPDGDGIYTADIQAPLVDGEYEIITVMNYEDPKLAMREMRLVTVVDPEGYIYEKNDGKETRIPGAIATLLWLNPENKEYELWPAGEYQQENPQTTDMRGTYSFLVPEGFYSMNVEAPGYIAYEGKPFQVSEGSGVHTNIELKTKYWWLGVVDWKSVLLIVVIMLLIYNFYKDKVRDSLLKK